MLTEEGAGNGAPAPPNARAAGQASPAGLLRKGPLRVLLQEEGGGSACSAPRRASGPRTHMPASRGEKPSGGEGRTPARSDHSVPTRLGEQKSRCAQLQGCLEEGRSPGRVRGGGACGTSRGSLGSDSGKRSPHPRRTAHGQLPHLGSAAQSALGLQGLRLLGGGWQESWGKLPSRGKHPDAPGKVEVSIVALTLPSSPCRWAASGWRPPPPAAQRPGTGTHTKLKRQRHGFPGTPGAA